MFNVYYLKSAQKDFHYSGCTSDMDKRLVRHNRGAVRATKRFLPMKLIGHKLFDNKEEAFRFEKAVKKSYNLRQSFIAEVTNTAG